MSSLLSPSSSASTVSTSSTSTTHGQNELVGWLTEANQRKFYRLRGAELARFASDTADAHEKRAKIVGCALTRSGEASCTLSHPRWPKAWSVQADSAAQIKLWMHAFVVAGARKPKSTSTRSAAPALPPPLEPLRVDAMIPDDFVEEPPALPPDSVVVVDSANSASAPRRKSSTLKASPAPLATTKTSAGSAIVKSSSPKASDVVRSPRKGGSSIKPKPTATSDDAAVANSLARKGKSATPPDVVTAATTTTTTTTTAESSSTVRTDSSSASKSAVPATVDASSSVTSTRANGGALSPRPDREAPKPSVTKAKASAAAGAPAAAAVADAAIVSLELDRVHLVELFQDDSAVYFKTKGNSEETPNVQMPKQASSDGAEYAVSKGKTFPLSVCVVGRSDELSLSLVVNGEKLKFGAQWTLNGQEVRDHKTDAGQKATVVTLFVAIKFFEPPVSRVFMTARIKNTTAQRRIVVDVVQKVREAPPPVVSQRSAPGAAEARNPVATLKAPAVLPAKSVPALASPATAAASTPTAAAAAPAKPAAIAPAKSVPALTSPASPAAATAAVVAAAPASASATAPRTAVNIPLDELERVSATDDTTLYLARVAKASGATGWNVRSVGAQFSVRLGVPFPLRVAVGAAATELSVSLMGATKLKNGRDWRLHSQTRTGDGVDTVLLLNVVIVNASTDAPLTVNVALGGATRASMIVHVLPAAAAAAAPAAGLPPGWIEAQTPDKRVYYFNKALNKTSWVKPTVLTAAAVAATKRDDDDDDDDDGAAAAPLPPNWRATANADGRLYFFNVVTKETTWKRPTAAAAPAEAAAAKVGTQYASSSVLDDAAAPATAGGDGSDSSEGMGMVGLAMAGPEALHSDDDDDDSSVIGAEDLKAPNFMTLSDVRAKPVSLHDSDSFDGSRSDDDNDAGTRLLVQPSAINNRFDTWVGGAEKSSDDEAEAAVLEKARTSTSEAPSTSSPPGTASGSQPLSLPPALANKPLKPGWKAAVSSSGKTYWYHRASGQTTWVCPVEGEEQVELPPDWKQATSSSGQSYFYNARTKETTWVRPTAGPVAPTLPKGWKEAKAADGRPYFFNAKGVTRWQMPTEAADE
jgi:hypothetical protein